jgi:hypothetical protein
MNIDMYDFSEFERELLNPGKHPQAEAYFELAYRAIMDGDNKLAIEYMSKTEEAIQKGIVLAVLDGQKPLTEDYDYSKRAMLEVVR